MRICISNDAFYYLSEGEEPLDENNLEEALYYKNLFPDGYEIKRLPDGAMPGNVWCEMAGVRNDDWYDLEETEPLRRRLRLKITGADTVHVWLYDIETGGRVDYGVCTVDRNKKGEPFRYGKSSQHYLSRFRPRA